VLSLSNENVSKAGIKENKEIV